MKDATALEGGMTAAQLAEHVARLREQQGHPPKVIEPLALDRIATLLRVPQDASP